MLNYILDKILAHRQLKITKYELQNWKSKLGKWDKDGFSDFLEEVKAHVNSAKYYSRTQIAVRNGWFECLDFLQLSTNKSRRKELDWRTNKPYLEKEKGNEDDPNPEEDKKAVEVAPQS